MTAAITLSTPGETYYLSTSLVVPAGQDGILITANFVTLVLNQRIESQGDSTNINAGVLVAAGLSGITIIGNLGGNIRGFGFGVDIGPGGFLDVVDGVLVQDALIRGVRVQGTDDVVVKNCNVQNITGSTNSQNFYAIGIEVSAANAGGLIVVKDNIVNNVVPNFAANLEGVGISFSDNCQNAHSMGNLVRNDALAPPRADGLPSSYGTWVTEGGNVRHIHNHFESWEVGIASGSGTTGYINHNSFLNCVYQGATNNIRADAAVVIGAFNG